MPDWLAISRTIHAKKHYLPGHRYAFASGQQVVPILMAELGKLLSHYVLAFIWQHGLYKPVVLTGLGGGQNLYVNHDGKWLATYVPAFLRSHPFRLLFSEKRQKILCIHETHLVDNSQGEPLFDPDGHPTKPVQDTLNFLNECEINRRVTQAASAALAKAGVIKKWSFQIKQEQGQKPVQVGRLYKISEKALNNLNTAAFADLRNNGALGLAYAQIFSMNQVSQLTDRVKYHGRQKQSDMQELIVDQLFGDDDVLGFDNI